MGTETSESNALGVLCFPRFELRLNITQSGWETEAFAPDEVIQTFARHFPQVVELPGDPLLKALDEFERWCAAEGSSLRSDQRELVLQSVQMKTARGVPSRDFVIRTPTGEVLEGQVQRWFISVTAQQCPTRAVWETVREVLQSFGRGSIHEMPAEGLNPTS